MGRLSCKQRCISQQTCWCIQKHKVGLHYASYMRTWKRRPPAWIVTCVKQTTNGDISNHIRAHKQRTYGMVALLSNRERHNWLGTSLCPCLCHYWLKLVILVGNMLWQLCPCQCAHVTGWEQVMSLHVCSHMDLVAMHHLSDSKRSRRSNRPARAALPLVVYC